LTRKRGSRKDGVRLSLAYSKIAHKEKKKENLLSCVRETKREGGERRGEGTATSRSFASIAFRRRERKEKVRKGEERALLLYHPGEKKRRRGGGETRLLFSREKRESRKKKRGKEGTGFSFFLLCSFLKKGEEGREGC